MPCGFQPRAKDFPRRNRLISGLALGVLVIEAARRSGTLVTARYGAEQNREVFAVPGHPLDPRAEGTNQLLKSGATLVTRSDDILEILNPLAWQTENAAAEFRETSQVVSNSLFTETTQSTRTTDYESARPKGGGHASENLCQDTRDTVLAALGAAPIDIDELARATGIKIRDVNAILLELDLAGLVIRHGRQLVSRAQDIA